MGSRNMAAELIAQCAAEFRGPAPPAVSVNVSELLASTTASLAERSFEAALAHFAARTPHATQPPA